MPLLPPFRPGPPPGPLLRPDHLRVAGLLLRKNHLGLSSVLLRSNQLWPAGCLLGRDHLRHDQLLPTSLLLWSDQLGQTARSSSWTATGVEGEFCCLIVFLSRFHAPCSRAVRAGPFPSRQYCSIRRCRARFFHGRWQITSLWLWLWLWSGRKGELHLEEAKIWMMDHPATAKKMLGEKDEAEEGEGDNQGNDGEDGFGGG